MIARPHICLRCQLRLAKRSPLSRYQIAYQSSTTPIIIPTTTKDNSPMNQDDAEHIPLDYVKDDTKLSGSRPPSAFRNGPVTRKSHVKLYGYLGQLQEATRASLGAVNTLGEPAEVIVMKDSNFKSYEAALREVEAPAAEPVDILATLDNQRGMAGQKEVNENINHLRPKQGREPENLTGFDDLVQQLANSFTGSQLARYIQSCPEDKPEVVQSTPTKGSLIPWISPWNPQTSGHSIDGHTASIQGYSFVSYNGKQRLALRLMRECWKLELPQLEDSMGEVLLELRPEDFELLMNHSASALGQIINQYITTQGESFQGFKGGNNLIVTTTRDKCSLIVGEIEQTLARAHKIEIPIRSLTFQSLPDAPLRRQRLKSNLDVTTLKELGDLTGTVVHKDKSTVTISCFRRNHAGSSAADAALRLLVKSAGIPDRTQNWLGCKNVINAQKGMLLPFVANDGLSWRDRLRSWNRWTMPTQAEKKETRSIRGKLAEAISKEQPKIDALTPAAEQSIPVEIERSDSNPDASFASSSASWTSDYSMESSAIFGSILHRLRDESANPSRIRPADLLTKAHQTFSSKVENISHIFSSKYFHTSQMDPTHSVVLKFLPNLFYVPTGRKTPIGAVAMTAFPPVEMHLVANPDTKELELRDVQAIVSAYNTDLMLPDLKVDVRLEQVLRSRLKPEGIQGHSSYPPQIVEFIKNSNLNFDSVEKFQTPPKLMIPIASHMCLAPGFGSLNRAANKAPVHDIEYLFAGSEIRNSIGMKFDGWALQYTSIEAGQADGRRGQLRLQTTPRSDAFGEANEKEFIKSTMRIACALDAGKMPSQPILRPKRIAGRRGVSDGEPAYFTKRVDFGCEKGEGKDQEFDTFKRALGSVDIEEIEGSIPPHENPSL